MVRSWLIFAAWVYAAACLAQGAAPRQIDARRVAAAGVRVLEGRYVRVLTDLPSSAAVDELPALFDAAVPKWAAYFGMKENEVRGHWLGFVIEDRERFAALGMMPEEKPDFPNGFARDYEFWLVEQPNDYYRRHLFLHEGTHAFMQSQLGGAGAGWYKEGMAELLGTHSWRDRRLELGVFPAKKEDVPMWGRIKLVRDAFEAGKAWPLEAVLAIDKGRSMTTEHYAWTWALAALLDGHPQFRERFRALKEHVADEAFNERFREVFAEDWEDLMAEWEAFVAEIDYGYDIPRMAMTHRSATDVGAKTQAGDVAADRGWQSTGWLLRGGEAYRVTASGRFQIADDGKPWPCEPGGVTIEYHRGRPLGALLGALRPAENGGAANDPSFARPMMIGLGATVRPTRDAVFYVRVNDSPGKLGDNRGEVVVRLEREALQLTPGQ
jgi:hypothetical protein